MLTTENLSSARAVKTAVFGWVDVYMVSLNTAIQWTQKFDVKYIVKIFLVFCYCNYVAFSLVNIGAFLVNWIIKIYRKLEFENTDNCINNLTIKSMVLLISSLVRN